MAVSVLAAAALEQGRIFEEVVLRLHPASNAIRCRPPNQHPGQRQVAVQKRCESLALQHQELPQGAAAQLARTVVRRAAESLAPVAAQVLQHEGAALEWKEAPVSEAVVAATQEAQQGRPRPGAAAAQRRVVSTQVHAAGAAEQLAAQRARPRAGEAVELLAEQLPATAASTQVSRRQQFLP